MIAMIAIIATILLLFGIAFLFFYMVGYQTFNMMNDYSFFNKNYITFDEFVENMRQTLYLLCKV